MSQRRINPLMFYGLSLTLLLLLDAHKALCRTSVEKSGGEHSTDEGPGDDEEISTLDEINLAEVPGPPPSSTEYDASVDPTHSEDWYDEVFDVDKDSRKELLKMLVEAIREDNESRFKTILIGKEIDENASFVHPSPPNGEEIAKSTLLHWTALYSAPKCARTLLLFGVNLNAKDKRRLTPLHYAAIHGSPSVAEVLIENGAEIDGLDIRNQTPLHKACRSGEVEIVKLLLQNDANVNAVDMSRRTPLHSAAYHQHKEIIKILLEAGASKMAEDVYGNRPIDLACASDGVSYYYTELSAYYDLNCVYSTPSEIEELLTP